MTRDEWLAWRLIAPEVSYQGRRWYASEEYDRHGVLYVTREPDERGNYWYAMFPSDILRTLTCPALAVEEGL